MGVTAGAESKDSAVKTVEEPTVASTQQEPKENSEAPGTKNQAEAFKVLEFEAAANDANIPAKESVAQDPAPEQQEVAGAPEDSSAPVVPAVVAEDASTKVNVVDCTGVNDAENVKVVVEGADTTVESDNKPRTGFFQ